MCRAGTRKTEAYLEVSLTRCGKGNKRDFCKYIRSKKKTSKSKVRDLETKVMKKAEVFDTAFYLSFSLKDQLL